MRLAAVDRHHTDPTVASQLLVHDATDLAPSRSRRCCYPVGAVRLPRVLDPGRRTHSMTEKTESPGVATILRSLLVDVGVPALAYFVPTGWGPATSWPC